MEWKPTEQQSWRIRVTAKAKHFNFRFRFSAATYPSTQTLSFFRFSILLNLPHFLFTITSNPKKPKRPSFITPKIKNFFLKFQPKFPIKKLSIAPKTRKLSNLSYLMELQDKVGIGKECYVRIVMMVASLGYFVVSLLLKKFKMAKVMNLVALLLVGAVTMVCYLFYYNYINYNYWEYMGRSLWNKMGNLKLRV